MKPNCTGKQIGPSLCHLMEVLGKDRTLTRISRAFAHAGVGGNTTNTSMICCSKIKLLALAGIVLLMNSCGKGPQADFWWTYLAEFEGRPGSVVINLGLEERAPVGDCQKLIVTGVTYASADTNGLPDARELNALNALSEKRLIIVKQLTPYIYAGAFTRKGERLDYIYVKSTNGIRDALNKFHHDASPDRKPYTNVKNDPQWETYSKFLFPNEQTIALHRQELVRIGYFKK